MSRGVKIFLGVVVGLSILCCLGFVITTYIAGRAVQSAVISDPAEAAKVGQSIITYEVPAGFQEQGGMDLAGVKMVFIGEDDSNGDMAIMLMQFPSSMASDPEAMRTQMEQALSQQTGQQNAQLSQVGTQDISINDQTTTLYTYEGKGDNGEDVRQITAVFNTKDNNTGMLMIIGNQANWNEDLINGFINSLH